MNRITFTVLLFFCLLNNATAQTDFRSETIYFLITSRFFDGDTSNSAPTEWCSYIPGVTNPNITDPKDVSWRGDFKGLIQQLDYIKGMGFTAIWITPIVQGRSPLDYHGYHAWDFTKVDSRLESPGATFKDLCDAVHAKGMKIVLDIVTNHSGRYGVKGQAELKYNTDPTKSWGQTSTGQPLPANPNWSYDGITKNPDDGKIWSRANLAKLPAPYNANLSAFNWPCTEAFVTTSDPNWFHQSGNGFAQGWDDTTNCYQRAVSDDCPDLNTGSKAVQDYFFNVYKNYIDMGVDAFRWDTWKHMNKQDIFALYDRFKAYKPDLFVFGEVAQKRFELHPVEEINPHWYTWRGAVGSSAPVGVGVLDFFAEATFHNIFENGGAFSGVTDAARYDHLYSDPSLLITWLDNHDFGPNNDWNRRYGGSEENLAACLNFMFTWRGIPSLYYGTEMQFMKGAYTDLHDPAGVTKSLDETGRAYYGNNVLTAVNHKIYKHLAKLNAIRRAIPALQKGSWNWGGNYPGNGIGYKREYSGQIVCVGLAKDGDASFSFSGLTNGIYRDAVTGREINVSNGTLQFTVKSLSAGIYVLNGPGMIGESGAGYFEACVTGCAPAPKVTISPVGDNYNAPITVTISATGGTPGYTIYYTTDGSTPTTSSPVYTSSFQVSVATTVRAIAKDANGKISDLAGQHYTFVLPKPKVTITPASGNFYDPFNVTISASSGTAPYTIYYTTNGAEPTTSSAVYTAPFSVSTASTVKAIAVDSKSQQSTTTSNSYTFNIPAPVITANPAGGNYPTPPINVTLTASSPRTPVTIYYTTDGSTPTVSSTVYSSAIPMNGSSTVTLKFIGKDNEGRVSTVDSQRYTFSPIPDMWLYFKKPASWASTIKIYYWNAAPSGAVPTVAWPGVAMEQVCTGSAWYRYKFNGVSAVNVIFDDGGTNKTPDLVNVTTSGYYDNGWLTTAPDVTKPTSAFTMTPSTGAAPLTVNFNAQSSTGCGTLTYYWDFGNGRTDNSVSNPSTTYNAAGTYIVKLIVKDQNQVTDSITQSITVTSAPVGMTVHFKRPTDWTKTPKLYFWNVQPAGALSTTWPGVQMVDEGNGWWKFTLQGVNCTNLLFNNDASPQTGDLFKCGDCWYDGAWVNAPTGVNDWLLPSSAVRVYPNPAQSVVALKNDQLPSGVYTIRLTDVTGRVGLQQTIRLEKGQTHWISRERLQTGSGTYIINLIDSKGNNRWAGKLVLQ